MKCKNRLCVYQKDGECIAENEIELDWHGLCKNMVPIRISEHNLYYEKLITKLQFEDGEHCLDNETGIVHYIADGYSDGA